MRGKDENVTAEVERLRYEGTKAQIRIQELELVGEKLAEDSETHKEKLRKLEERAKTLDEKNSKLNSELKREKSENDTMNKSLQLLKSAFEKLTKSAKAIEQQLSCLSCLDYLDAPAMTLICGHSICKTVSLSCTY